MNSQAVVSLFSKCERSVPQDEGGRIKKQKKLLARSRDANFLKQVQLFLTNNDMHETQQKT